MTLASILKQILKELKVSVPELAKLDDQSYQNLNKKIRNETLGYDEFVRLLGLLDVKFEYNIVLPGQDSFMPETEDKTKDKIDLLIAENQLLKKKLELQDGIDKDVRTSLNNIVGSVDIISTHVTDNPKLNFYLKRVKDESKKINLLLYNGEEFFEENVDDIVVNPEDFDGKRVLIVEDNELNSEILNNILCDYNMRTTVAHNGLEAVNLINSNGSLFFDFILMDIEMPILNGYEVTKIIRKMSNGQQVPVIATTSNVALNDRYKAKEVGIDYYVTKPINRDLLLKVMTKFL